MANKEFTKKWSSALIEDIVFKIKGGCIVPIIGPGVYYIEGENCGIQQFIVRELLRRNIPSKADDADIDKWKKYVRQYQLNWVNVGGTNVNIDYQEAYNVHGTPTMIILNEERRIIMNKVLPTKSILPFLKRYGELLPLK